MDNPYLENHLHRLNKIIDPNLIKLKYSLAKDQKVNDLILLAKTTLQNLPSCVSYKTNSEFILYICKLVENYITKDEKFQKRDVVITILKSVLGTLTDAEIKAIENIIEFLHQNGMINPIKLVKKLNVSISGWLKKKIL